MKIWKKEIDYILHEPFRQNKKLDVKPCMKHYELMSEYLMVNYNMTIYHNTRVRGMLTVVEKT